MDVIELNKMFYSLFDDATCQTFHHFMPTAFKGLSDAARSYLLDGMISVADAYFSFITVRMAYLFNWANFHLKEKREDLILARFDKLRDAVPLWRELKQHPLRVADYVFKYSAFLLPDEFITSPLAEVKRYYSSIVEIFPFYHIHKKEKALAKVLVGNLLVEEQQPINSLIEQFKSNPRPAADKRITAVNNKYRSLKMAARRQMLSSIQSSHLL